MVLQFRTASDASSRERRAGGRKAGFDFQASIKRTGVTTQTRTQPVPADPLSRRQAPLGLDRDETDRVNC